jgi:hypothetical protein
VTRTIPGSRHGWWVLRVVTTSPSINKKVSGREPAAVCIECNQKERTVTIRFLAIPILPSTPAAEELHYVLSTE